VRVYLTEAGKKKREKAKETVLNFNEAVREVIPQEKLEVFFEVIQAIQNVVEKDTINQKAYT